MTTMTDGMNRSRIDMYADMLKVAAKVKGDLKTHIMYRANLSHRQLEKYLAFLTEAGLILEVLNPLENNSRLYITTEKGIAFLKDYDKIQSYF